MCVLKLAKGVGLAVVVAAAACDEPAPVVPPSGVAAPSSADDPHGKPSDDERAPEFLLPAESEASIVLGSGQCVEIRMTFADDAERLEITVDVPPQITGASLTDASDGYAAEWRWCPGAFGDVPPVGSYEVILVADDGVHLPTTRTYRIVVQEGTPTPGPEEPEPGGDEDCSEGWPTIEYQPATVEDGVAMISALLIDDEGIVGYPLIEMTFEDPSEEAPETRLVPMALADGDRTAGVWMVEVPMEAPTLYYRYLAEDSVPGQPCPHMLEEPAEGFLDVTE